MRADFRVLATGLVESSPSERGEAHAGVIGSHSVALVNWEKTQASLAAQQIISWGSEKPGRRNTKLPGKLLDTPDGIT